MSNLETNTMLLLKKDTVINKVISIIVLVLLLLIPIGMINSVLSERLQRRNEAIQNITSTWGKSQVVFGPVLIIPYRYAVKVWKDQIIDGKKQKIEVIDSAISKAYFLSSDMEINGSITSNKLHRGIYEAVVYTANIKISGQYMRPEFESLRINENDVIWDDAVVTFAITDLRGTRNTLQLKFGENTFQLTPGTILSNFSSGVSAKVTGLSSSGKTIPYSVDFTLNGSSEIHFAPAGVQNNVKISSSWTDPSFKGAFLPTERKINSDGFNALWQVSYYGRDYPQQWTEGYSQSFNQEKVAKSLFGVSFVSLIDSYRNVERAIKYGILFITLVFTTFFLFEVISSVKIHPFQYTLVGLALSLFYLCLLSFSEFLNFFLSYIISAFCCIILIIGYCAKVLKSGTMTLIIAAGLLFIYIFLYIILQMQDYSLLFGTVGLSIVLALVMYVTRNIDWYERDAKVL